ncbi:hypothetical protein ACFUVV_01940 [Streptomyces sp. NPDC057376]|uniref:hypothetical protein n=1 Tax=unclassified Streptomyces TaxID=2593676 RepID=UPI0009389B01|nr:hypothetical protein [Streptomyces sp. CB02414]OKI86888.1 hypothetical protein AMK11_12220 [Streptomyces sp. CB02414]
MLVRTRTADRYARAVAAGVTAVACLLLASNAGPADTARAPVPATEQDTAPVTDSVTDSVVTVGR